MMKPAHTRLQLAPRSHRGSLSHDTAPDLRRDRAMRQARQPRHGRFVTESHVLSAPLARPASLAIAAAVAVALVIVTHKLTH